MDAVPGCFVRDSPFCRLGSLICPEITLSMSFVLVAMVSSFPNPLGKPTLTERILAQPFLICIYYLIRYVWRAGVALLLLHLGDERKLICCFVLQDLIPTKPTQAYVPRIYGFRVNESSPYYRNREDDGRMQADAQSRSSRRSRRQGR